MKSDTTNASLVARQFPQPYKLSTLHESARSLGLKTGRITTAIGLNLTTEAQAEFEQEAAL